MADLIQQQGALKKLVFIPCKDPDCTQEDIANQYAVMFNPNNIAIKLQVERDSQQPDGAVDGLMKFKKIQPQDYTFEFIIDGTGASGTTRDVPEDVKKFLSAVYDYDGTEHKPNYIKIVYGSVLLKCVLKSVDITYNLFSPNGKPLRAKVNASFTSCKDPQLSEAIKNSSSPDMTHARKLKGKDKLVGIANGIYKNNNLYLEVARANQFDTFRNLPEGTEVFFPPVDKKSASIKTITNG